MTFQHSSQLQMKWHSLTLHEQMANVGAEVGRAINWKAKENQENAKRAAERALELLSLTIDDHKNLAGMKELTRTYELLVDLLLGSNEYQTNSDSILKYFLEFNYVARRGR